MICKRQTHKKVSLVLFILNKTSKILHIIIKSGGGKLPCEVCVHIFAFNMCSCHPGNLRGHYKVHFSLEIICEPAVPIKVIDVQCAAQVNSTNIHFFFVLLTLSQITFRDANICITTFFSVQLGIY